MTKSAAQKSTKKPSYTSQEDLFRGEGFYDLVDELRHLDEEHTQLMKSLDSRYEDMQGDLKLRMFETYRLNKDELAIMRRKIKVLGKINRILEQANGGFTDVGA